MALHLKPLKNTFNSEEGKCETLFYDLRPVDRYLCESSIKVFTPPLFINQLKAGEREKEEEWLLENSSHWAGGAIS